MSGEESFSFTRNTPKHDLCLSLLTAGHIQSFCDLFYLTHRIKDAVISAAGEIVEKEKQVDVNENDLAFLAENLKKAETATRVGENSVVFGSFLTIARFYEKTNEMKLAIYFHEKSLHVARHSLDKESEASAHAALAACYEALNDLELAIEHHERHLRLSKRNKNNAEEARGQVRLFKVYERYADQCEAAGDWEGAVKYHGKCMEISMETLDEKGQGQVELRLGLANVKLGRNDVAAKHFEKYLDLCIRLHDNEGACVATHNLARTYKDLGQTQNAVEYLERLLELSQQAEHRIAQSDACTELGTIYNNKGDFQSAIQYFEESFDLARTIGKQDKIESSRVALGIAKGNNNLQEFMTMVQNPDPLVFLKWRLGRN